MLNSLSGTINYKDDGRVFLQSGDVEWEILTSRTSCDGLPDAGQAARLFVYLHHRDDQLKLFGFAQAGERDAFLDLLKVEGVGPRQALKILSGVEVHRLVEALDGEDVGFLSAIPGVGAKTAQKILLKLKGKMVAGTPAGASVDEDVVNALAGMGFDRKTARGAVASARRTMRERGGAEAAAGVDAAGGAPAGTGKTPGRREPTREELERQLFQLAIAQLAGPEGRA